MPVGHPHASWAHVGALWPAVPASDDAIHSETVDWPNTCTIDASRLHSKIVSQSILRSAAILQVADTLARH